MDRPTLCNMLTRYDMVGFICLDPEGDKRRFETLGASRPLLRVSVVGRYQQRMPSTGQSYEYRVIRRGSQSHHRWVINTDHKLQNFIPK